MDFFFPCKRKKMLNALAKLRFHIKEKAKHTKAECTKNGKKTTIPRHTEIKRETVKNICDFLLKKDFKKEEILKNLK